MGLSLAAFGGALVVTMLLIRLARRARLGHGRLLLFGVAIGILTNAAMTWLMYFADDGALREFMFWMMGSLAYGSQQLAWWWLVLPLTLGWLCWQGRHCNNCCWGDPGPPYGVERGQHAGTPGAGGLPAHRGGGLPVRRHRFRRPGGASPAAPVRWQRSALPAARLGAWGGALLLGADLVARSALHAGELPIGVITASVGAPLFIYLLLRQDADVSR